MRVLGVGIATLDIINSVDGYPREDDEVRARSQRRSRGGNATNTLTVLSSLGHACSWAGVLPADHESREVEMILQSADIDLSEVRRLGEGRLPTSFITLNIRNGSRTIVHYRDLPEYRAAWFDAIDLRPFDWIHFEGRAPEELGLMLRRAAKAGVRVSLEVEKPRPGIESLFALPDVLLFSREYARAQGSDSAAALLQSVGANEFDRRPLCFCTWGDAGAWALTTDDMLYHQPAFEVPRVLDTIGAGDVFNAGVIAALLDGSDAREALRCACELAAVKCGRIGLENLATAKQVNCPGLLPGLFRDKHE
ncbi:MAG: PfkB family carbohydrate kinase [Gammaproteobacteria bacterium]|jgi:ketohexokinase